MRLVSRSAVGRKRCGDAPSDPRGLVRKVLAVLEFVEPPAEGLQPFTTDYGACNEVPAHLDLRRVGYEELLQSGGVSVGREEDAKGPVIAALYDFPGGPADLVVVRERDNITEAVAMGEERNAAQPIALIIELLKQQLFEPKRPRTAVIERRVRDEVDLVAPHRRGMEDPLVRIRCQRQRDPLPH